MTEIVNVATMEPNGICAHDWAFGIRQVEALNFIVVYPVDPLRPNHMSIGLDGISTADMRELLTEHPYYGDVFVKVLRQ